MNCIQDANVFDVEVNAVKVNYVSISDAVQILIAITGAILIISYKPKTSIYIYIYSILYSVF